MPTPEEVAAAKATEEAAASAAQAEQVKAITNAVRESLGFKEGERFDEKIRGAAADSLQAKLGLEEGQTVKDMMASMLRDQKPADPPPTSPKDIAAAELKAVTEAVGGMQKQLNEANAATVAEKRGSLIRDALSQFKIEDAYVGVLTRSFLHGVEADPGMSQDGAGLVVKTDGGQNVDFGEFLVQYFESNKQFLKDEKSVGTGAVGADGKPPVNGVFKFDYKKHMEDGGAALREEAVRNPDGGVERQEAVGKVMKKKVDDFFAAR